MASNKRMFRINDEIKRCLSEILRSELRDPRINPLTTVLKVKTSADLEHCIVYVSVLSEKKDESVKGLNSAASFIKKLVAEKINLRVTPDFRFILDDSLEYSIKINELIDRLK